MCCLQLNTYLVDGAPVSCKKKKKKGISLSCLIALRVKTLDPLSGPQCAFYQSKPHQIFKSHLRLII